jgi:hypothetical protein
VNRPGWLGRRAKRHQITNVAVKRATKPVQHIEVDPVSGVLVKPRQGSAADPCASGQFSDLQATLTKANRQFRMNWHLKTPPFDNNSGHRVNQTTLFTHTLPSFNIKIQHMERRKIFCAVTSTFCSF